MRSVPFLGLALAAALAFSGCSSKSSGQGFARLTAEFKSADPALKAKADGAAAAFQTNDYLGSVLPLEQLKTTPGLAPKQTQAVEDALGVAMDKVFADAAAGNPQAVQARDTLRELHRRPGAK